MPTEDLTPLLQLIQVGRRPTTIECRLALAQSLPGTTPGGVRYPC